MPSLDYQTLFLTVFCPHCKNALPGLPDSVPNSILSTWCTLVVYCDSTHPCLVSLRQLSQNKYIPQPPTAEIYYRSCLMIDRHNRHCQDTLTLEQKLDMHNWSMQVNMSIFWHDYCWCIACLSTIYLKQWDTERILHCPCWRADWKSYDNVGGLSLICCQWVSRYIPVPCVFETFISKQVCHKQKLSVYMFTPSCVHVSGIGLIICIPM
jgi:hypothetical protein